MPDILQDARVAKLLQEVDHAYALFQDKSRDDRQELKLALDSMYRDLGKYLHVFYRKQGRQAPKFLPDDPTQSSAPPGFTNETPEPTEDEDFYTQEVDLSPPEPLEPDEERDWAGPAQGEPGRVVAADAESSVLVRAEEILGPEGLPALLAAEPDATWREDLTDLMALLAPTPDLTDPHQLANEAACIQWVSIGLEDRLSALPDLAQVALLGLLASRARLLEKMLDVNIGPQTALERLRRHRAGHHLPRVVALDPEAGPEHGSWGADATRWHGALSGSP